MAMAKWLTLDEKTSRFVSQNHIPSVQSSVANLRFDLCTMAAVKDDSKAIFALPPAPVPHNTMRSLSDLDAGIHRD